MENKMDNNSNKNGCGGTGNSGKDENLLEEKKRFARLGGVVRANGAVSHEEAEETNIVVAGNDNVASICFQPNPHDVVSGHNICPASDSSLLRQKKDIAMRGRVSTAIATSSPVPSSAVLQEKKAIADRLAVSSCGEQRLTASTTSPVTSSAVLQEKMAIAGRLNVGSTDASEATTDPLSSQATSLLNTRQIEPEESEAQSNRQVVLDTEQEQTRLDITTSITNAFVVDEAHEAIHRLEREEELMQDQKQRVMQEMIDQMPHAQRVDPDEIIQERKKVERRRQQQRRRTYCVFTVSTLAVLCSIIVIVVVLVVNQGRNNEDTQSLPSRHERLMNLLLPISSGQELRNKSSPRYEAFQWLLNEDPSNTLSVLDDDETRIEWDWVLVERYVAVLFFLVTGGPSNWTSVASYFLSNTTVCYWFDPVLGKGIQCHPSSGRIYFIQIYENNLQGTLPPELFALQDLEAIVLHSNHLHGSIPSSLKNNRRLERISVYHNALTGTIPDLSNLRNFQTLELFDNHFSGTIPAWLITLGELRTLNLNDNFLTGSLPSFGSASQDRLDWLVVSGNLLTGSIPPAIGSLMGLEMFAIGGNALTNSIPTTVGNLRNLKYLFLAQNQLTGSIPAQIGWMENLAYLHSYSNQLTGPLPTELGLLWKLVHVVLAQNHLTGTIPPQLNKMDSLSILLLHNNTLTGDLTDMCFSKNTEQYGGNFNGKGLERLHSFTADCQVGAEQDELDGDIELICPCCSICCNDASGKCDEVKGVKEVCQDKAKMFEEQDKSMTSLSEQFKGTTCTCSDDGHTVYCKDTNCLFCDDQETVCYVDAQEGIGFGIYKWYQYFISIQYVQGRDELVSFRFNGTCSGSINGEECKACLNIACRDGYETFELDCSNLGYGRLSACYEADDPFFAVWDLINQFKLAEMTMPTRFNCIEHNSSSRFF